MSKTTTEQTAILVDLLDADGCPTGREVLVHVEYTCTVDDHYGEDADGHRGVRSVEYEVLHTFLDPDDLKTVNAREAEQALKDAGAIFNNRRESRHH